jgi:hypothetical protein
MLSWAYEKVITLAITSQPCSINLEDKRITKRKTQNASIAIAPNEYDSKLALP